jgi:D-glycero-D-manno-heptose 1,7-bisphosphate phosphatase
MTRAVFLDRDGVLIANVMVDGVAKSASRPQEVVLLTGVEQACAGLKKAGFLLVMVTNQPDAKRGRTPREFVEKTNADLAQLLGLDAVQVCWHVDADGCGCRKPAPGLLLDAAQALKLDLRDCVMVGDRWRDISAGRAAGCTTVLVGDNPEQIMPEPPHHRAVSLLDAAPWIIAHTHGKQSS